MITLDPALFWPIFAFAIFGVLAFITAIAMLILVVKFYNEPDPAERVGLRATIFGDDQPIPVADTAAVRAELRRHVQGLG